VVTGWSAVVTGWSAVVMFGTNMCDPFPAAAGVVTSISFTINPPSTNSRIVCRRKDRGGCGSLRRWPWCF
jgi:hypothetical protein